MKRTIIWQEVSRYALVKCINNGKGIIVEKEISPATVNNSNAVWVNEVSLYFRQELHALNVLLAEPYCCFEKNGKAIQQSPYVGLDIEKLMKKGQVTTATLEKLISTISGVLTQEIPKVGIDARLSNFCIGPEEDVIYVDTFPPLVKYHGQYIVHFPNPTDEKVIEQELKRKFDYLGILRRLRFSILEQNAGFTEKDILQAIENVMGKNFYLKTAEFFETFLDHMEVSTAIDKIEIHDTDGIRELALRLMPTENGLRKKFLEEIFDLSSNFCSIKLTNDERLVRIQNLLMKQFC